jgi:hypothetical protein
LLKKKSLRMFLRIRFFGLKLVALRFFWFPVL